MCGIAGIISKEAVKQLPVLKIMANSLAHRGPDDEGIEIIGIDGNDNFSIGLVHRRLAVIDLSEAGHQPMSNEDDRIWIVYNGEIYNYKDIREELKTRGHRFKSNSDTEVIIHAYEEWGTDCLQKLRGMFSFALLDRIKKVLLLAVDRFGIKPLYYYEGKDNLFLFASELRTILNSGLMEKHIDSFAINSFLAYGAIQAPLTIIKGIYALLPAHYLIYDLSIRKKKDIQYWNPACRISEKSLNNETEVSQKIRSILENCVQRHLVSDVPVGLFLSGGIDSSSIVALANKLKKGTLRSFSVIFPEPKFSEKKYSRLISNLYCKNHTEIVISQDDLLNFLPYALEAMDQPTIDGINVYAISKFVRDAGIKVVLSGQGGDEVFGGYPTFKRIPFIQRMYNLAKPLPFSLRKTLGNIIDGFESDHFNFRGSKFSQILSSYGDYLSVYLIERQIFTQNVRKYLLKNYQEEKMFDGLPLQVVRSLSFALKTLDVFNKISYLELCLYLANTLLRDGDFMSMSHGLEVRVPFLDHELIEYVFTIAQELKTDNALPKPLLINAVKDLIPEAIYLRKKMGFTFPWGMWLKHKLRSQICEVFNNFPLNNGVGLDVNKCQELLRMFLQNKPHVKWSHIWAIYVLMVWLRKNA